MSEEQYGKTGAILVRGLQEAIAYERGELTGLRVDTAEVTARKAHLEPPPWYPPHLIREVRHKLSVSQTIFAQMLGVSASTVRAWEQGKRECEGPASRLLQIADLHPEVLKEVCGEIYPATDGARPLPRTLRAPAAGAERLAADRDSD
ncbi:MAG TPA: type II toxin-antitoxin system MqsA family antitoxin [Longimicrobium sp.]|nr:type II toxin-antitoxin system MqsA family antitoxin [Longimicrobium sp.]